MKHQFVQIQPSQGEKYFESEGREARPAEAKHQFVQIQPAHPREVSPPLPLRGRPSATGKGLLSEWKANTPAPHSTPGKGLLSKWKADPLPPLQVTRVPKNLPAEEVSGKGLLSRWNTGLVSALAVEQKVEHGPMRPPLTARASVSRQTPLPTKANSRPPLRITPSVKRPSVGAHSAQKQRRRRRFPMWGRITSSILMVLLILVSSGTWYYYANFADPIRNITAQGAAHIGEDADAAQHTNGTTGDILSGKRINILLLGSDTDGKNTAPLAQTDIVVTIDPQTQYVGMLSIPRDLRVNVPGFGPQKLDAAFAYGWQYEHVGPTPFSNAVGLSIETVFQDFGIPIDYYAWVGLDGFIKVIDTAGGVDMDVTHPITDDVYPDDVSHNPDVFAYQRLYIAPGPQHLNGVQALEYVRTRHSDLVGDFGRSARQQQVLSQLKNKLDSPSILGMLPELARDLNGYVKTDMQLSDVLKIMNFARTIDPNKVDRVILSSPYSQPIPNSSDFQPNCTLIEPIIARMFALGNNAHCSAQTNNTRSYSLASSMAMPPALPPTTTLSLSNTRHIVNQVASTMSLKEGSGNLFGIHSLLDLLFLVTFESFDAVKV